MRHRRLTSAFVLPASVALAGAAPRASAQGGQNVGAGWAQYHVGDHVELDEVCSGHWTPATLVKIAPAGGYGRDVLYTVHRQDGSDWTFVIPARYPPCVRAVGGIARDRAALPAPRLGVYNCNYQGTVAPAFDFALLSGSTYRDYDGARGTYRYDAQTRQLLFLTGPKRGSRAQQMGATVFEFLGSDGAETGDYCPFNPARNANGLRL